MKYTGRSSYQSSYRQAECSRNFRKEMPAATCRKSKHSFQKYLLRGIISICILLSAVMITGNFLRESRAEASTVSTETVYYKSIEVSEGDTLWTLADQYMGDAFPNKEAYIREVKKLNHLNSDQIQSGAYLMIPYTEKI